MTRNARFLARPPRGWERAVYRGPVLLYRLGLGWLLGDRFVLLTHVGRRTGRPRQTVLEVIRREPHRLLVASGYGSRAQWYRNVLAEPRVRFQVGRRDYAGTAVPLPPPESGRTLRAYADRHARAAAVFMRAIGHRVDGGGEAYERIGADPVNGVPLVALLDDPRTDGQ